MTMSVGVPIVLEATGVLSFGEQRGERGRDRHGADQPDRAHQRRQDLLRDNLEVGRVGHTEAIWRKIASSNPPASSWSLIRLPFSGPLSMVAVARRRCCPLKPT